MKCIHTLLYQTAIGFNRNSGGVQNISNALKRSQVTGSTCDKGQSALKLKVIVNLHQSFLYDILTQFSLECQITQRGQVHVEAKGRFFKVS
jgi:hypothetical protein